MKLLKTVYLFVLQRLKAVFATIFKKWQKWSRISRKKMCKKPVFLRFLLLSFSLFLQTYLLSLAWKLSKKECRFLLFRPANRNVWLLFNECWLQDIIKRKNPCNLFDYKDLIFSNQLKLLAQCTGYIHCDSATALRILVFLEHQPLGFADTLGTIICGVCRYWITQL